MPGQDVGNLAKLLYDHFNKRAHEETRKLLADDVQITDVATGRIFRGPQGVREYQEGWIQAFPDARAEITHVCASDDTAVVEFRGRGTHNGPLKLTTGELAATGKKVDTPFCEVFRFKDGKVVEQRSYYDTATMARQLGVPLPPR